MKCVRRMIGVSLRDKIRNEELRKQLGITSTLEYIKKQQVKWFGHITRQKEQSIIQETLNKRYENNRPIGRPRKRWIDSVLETLGNITAEEANRRAKDRILTLHSTPKGTRGKQEEERSFCMGTGLVS